MNYDLFDRKKKKKRIVIKEDSEPRAMWISLK